MANDKKKIDQEKLKKELESVEKEANKDNKEMSDQMKGLLKDDLEEHRKQDKTRGAEMLSIFAAHNYYANGFTPVELRTTLEDLGPTYVKIGQIMSSRVDLLPENYCKELEKLRQNVKPLSAEVARAVIEEETGKKIDEIYSEFRDEPLGSASIGQAHYGVLKDGTKVVTKVQRPLIADMMRKDYVLLKKLAELVNVVVDDEDSMSIDLVSVIEELEKVSEEELDFRVEANNTKYFKENCVEDEKKITCPTVIDELTTERIFTMTFVDGYTVSHKDRLIKDGYDPLVIGKAIAENYTHQVLDVGYFHADPHQGNIMISAGKPYWIDFGMVGRIGNKEMNTIQKMVLSLVTGDKESLVNAIASMGGFTSKTNRDKLTEDAQLLIDRFSGSAGQLEMSGLLSEVLDLASKHYIKVPGQYTMLARSVLAMEGVLEQLCPNLDLFKLLSDKMIEREKKNFDIKQALIDAGGELLGAGRKATKIPGLIADSLSGLSRGKMKINMELTGYEEPLDRIGVYIKYVVLSIIACVLFIGSCILSGVESLPKTDIGRPLMSVAGILFSIARALYSGSKLTKKK